MRIPVLGQGVKVAGLNEELDAREVAFGGRQVQGRPPVVVLGLHVLVGEVKPGKNLSHLNLKTAAAVNYVQSTSMNGAVSTSVSFQELTLSVSLGNSNPKKVKKARGNGG